MALIDHIRLFSAGDAAALLLLFGGWWVVGRAIERIGADRPSVTVLMMRERRDWMRQMLTRQPRIFDATILGGLRQSTSFYASTTVIAIGGVLALIGNAETLSGVATEFGEMAPPVVYRIKLALVALLLTEGFLKFVWANRLFGYCAVVMAAVPNDPGHPEAVARAGRAAELNIRAAWNFNRGLRALYVALAAVAWLAGWVALMLAAAAVLWTIWAREFRSLPRAILIGGHRPEGGAEPGAGAGPATVDAAPDRDRGARGADGDGTG